jgi:hypothetical protein
MMGAPDWNENSAFFLKQKLDWAESYVVKQEQLILELIKGLSEIANVTVHSDWRNKKTLQTKQIAVRTLEAAKTHFKAMGWRYDDDFK